MSDVVIRPVEGNKLMDEFIRVPRIIYQDCPQYVPDLDSDVRKLFDVRETLVWNFPTFSHLSLIVMANWLAEW